MENISISIQKKKASVLRPRETIDSYMGKIREFKANITQRYLLPVARKTLIAIVRFPGGAVHLFGFKASLIVGSSMPISLLPRFSYMIIFYEYVTMGSCNAIGMMWMLHRCDESCQP
ncbi:MAG: hypothetical protein ACLVAW_25145 [Eisenbergiella massiliensis]